MTGHDGVFVIKPFDVHEYYEEYRPVVLRDRRTTDTLGLPAMNIGVAKKVFHKEVMSP
jgi:DNA helicase-2/ATP-dependent DNA helicase PcrA